MSFFQGLENKQTVECRLVPPFLTKSRSRMPLSSSRGAFCAVLVIRPQAVCPALAVYPADRGRKRRCEIYEDRQRPLLRTSTQPEPKGHHTPVMRAQEDDAGLCRLHILHGLWWVIEGSEGIFVASTRSWGARGEKGCVVLH